MLCTGSDMNLFLGVGLKMIGDFKMYNIINNVDVYGLDESLRRSKFPMAVDAENTDSTYKEFHNKLASSKIGSGDDNWLMGIIVQFDLTFTIKAWTEAERYHFLDIISSQSTMHRISKMDIEPNCIEYVSPIIIQEVERLKEEYNNDKSAENFLRLVYSVPVGFKLTAGMTTNYRQLKTIYYQRRNHRLPEWREFCAWIETLPMFKDLVLGGEKND